MSHEIFGERFAGFRQPAWHGLGVTFDERVDWRQAVEAAHLDYTIFKAPLLAYAPDATQIPIPDRFVLLREPVPDDDQWRILSSFWVGPQYAVLQNAQILEMLQPLYQRWPIETVGALGMGERLFVTLDAGTVEIKGDPVRQYFLLSESRKAGESLTMAFTPVRVVCQNTLTLALNSAAVTLQLPHHSRLGEKVSGLVDWYAQAERVQARAIEQMNFFASCQLAEKQLETFLTQTYPYPTEPTWIAQESPAEDASDEQRVLKSWGEELESAWSSRVEKQSSLRQAARSLFERFNDEQPTLANTGWAAWNAVVELEDWRETRSKQPGVAVLFGERAFTKQRALSVLEQILNG